MGEVSSSSHVEAISLKAGSGESWLNSTQPTDQGTYLLLEIRKHLKGRALPPWRRQDNQAFKGVLLGVVYQWLCWKKEGPKTDIMSLILQERKESVTLHTRERESECWMNSELEQTAPGTQRGSCLDQRRSYARLQHNCVFLCESVLSQV